uniref:deoxyribose-phosphate aldolase n=1 Tax=Panagrellus redivivus TaxID=6233 RepID=A0A7E4VB23_PANRE
MHFVNAAVFLFAVIGQSLAKVELRKGINQTVTFEGEEVEIDINRGSSSGGILTLCFGSTSDASVEICPKGYAGVITNVGTTITKYVFKVSRQGSLTVNSNFREITGTIQFNEDGALNILVKKLPDDGTTVILPNAEKWVPKKKSENKEKQKKSTSNATMYISIACCVLVALILIAIGVTVYVFIIRKKCKSNPVPVVPPEEYQCEFRDETPEIVEVPTSPVIVEPEIKIHTPSQSPATPITEGMVKGPNEKVPMPIGVAPPPPPKQKTDAVPKLAPPPSIPVTKAVAPAPEPMHPPSTPPSLVSPVNAKTAEPPAKPTPASAPKSKSPSRKHKSATLPLDKTQSATKRSPPTEGFGQDKVANALADNSKYNVRGYLPHSEASLPDKPIPTTKSAMPALTFENAFEKFTATTPIDGRDEAIAAAKVAAVEVAKDKTEVRKLISFIDLTTLAGDDTPARVKALVDKALAPIPQEPSVHCGAVCVYPARVKDVVSHLASKGASLPVASVAGGFPSGQYHLKSKLLEIHLCVEDGATEIDTVISRGEALDGHWNVVHEELLNQKNAAGKAHLKVILATGELQTDANIHKASWAAMLAGADFIKTSTGKETVNATLEVAYVMLRAIKAYTAETGRKVGFKPAGGIKTVSEALEFVALVRAVLGEEWVNPELFRIGASSLLDNVIQAL